MGLAQARGGRTLMVSSVGTSILTNLDQQAAPAEKAPVITWTNAPARDDVLRQAPEAAARLDALIDRARRAMQTASIEAASDLSAELNSLLLFYDRRPPPSTDYHLLLCTDTWLGTVTGELVLDWLTRHGAAGEVVRLRDLRTDDGQAFQLALTETVNYLDEVVPNYRQQGYQIVFNLNGGFKAVQGFLQTLGMFHEAEIIYRFNPFSRTDTTLLHIPRLPIRLDAERTVAEHLPILRRLALGLRVAPDDPALAPVPDGFLLRVGDGVAMSPWGEVVWNRTRDALYRKAFHTPSPSPLVRLTATFVETVTTYLLTPGHLADLNERIDQLARFCETGRRENPKGLDFKTDQRVQQLYLPANRKFDAWANDYANAWRCVGHDDPDRGFTVTHLVDHDLKTIRKAIR